jgi:hypothetical protein
LFSYTEGMRTSSLYAFPVDRILSY